MKANILKLKEDIKKLVEEQKFFKNQRKTVNLVGERKVETWRASSGYFTNRMKLSAMYVAYGVLRGKDLETEIQNHVSKRPEAEYYKVTIINNAKKLIEEYSKVDELVS